MTGKGLHVMSWWTLAIDIGTTSVPAAVRDRAGIETVEFAGRQTLPPAVFCPAGEPPLAGLPAAGRAAAQPRRAVLSPKRALADGDAVTVGGTAIPLTEVYAVLLAEVAREAARGRTAARPRRLVLAYPAG